MKLIKLETEILARALENQKRENRQAPHWRPAVKCPLPAPSQEAGQDPVSLSLYEGNHNTINAGFFLQQVKKIFGNEIVQSRTNWMQPEDFQKIGFFFAAGSVYFSRREAQEIIEAWQQKAPWLDYFILPELEPYVDLFAAEVLGGMTGYGWEYKTRHKMIDLGADPKAVEQYEKAAKKLEDKGLVIRLQGQDMACKWVGINITKLGVEVLKENESQAAAPASPETEPDGPRLKCLNCGGVFHRMTAKFDPDVMPRGEMFSLLPKYKDQGWEVWQDSWTGESLVCPNCGEPFMSPHTKKLCDGAMVEPETV
ncbi:hypothetical protein [Desulfobacter curvatus]|uniref:hypothetical protein n=1 Tax=Desulfobacter curvatus TaxID=2290 RepID=UPI00035F7C66|nr:hypothetical protein [Desulfobacter curvatus]